MFRSLKAAFWLRAKVPLLGAIPVNALAFFGLLVLGIGNIGFAFLGIGLEALYLLVVTGNGRFQALVEAIDQHEDATETAVRWDALVARLDPARRARLEGFEGRCRRLRTTAVEEVPGTSAEAIKKLRAIYLKLLVARQHLGDQEGEPALAEGFRREIGQLESELAAGSTPSVSLRESTRARLDIVRQRLDNVERRTRRHAEIESDLKRIEAQVDLAVENAAISGAPAVISGHIDLASSLLDGSLYGDYEREVSLLDRELEADGDAVHPLSDRVNA